MFVECYFYTDSQAIAGLMDRQRQDQETLLRAFTDGKSIFSRCVSCYGGILTLLCSIEISGEIKGERLRFVEAMKEATAINVQSKF